MSDLSPTTACKIRLCSSNPRMHLQAHHKRRGMKKGPPISIEGQDHTSEQLSPRQPVKFKQSPIRPIPLTTQHVMEGASNMTPPTASVNLYDRLKATLAKSRAVARSNGTSRSANEHPNVHNLSQPALEMPPLSRDTGNIFSHTSTHRKTP